MLHGAVRMKLLAVCCFTLGWHTAAWLRRHNQQASHALQVAGLEYTACIYLRMASSQLQDCHQQSSSAVISDRVEDCPFVQMWDLRKFKAPLNTFEDLPNLMSTTQVCFGPDDKLAVTGTSADCSGQGASLVFIDLGNQSVIRRVGMPASVVAVQWHQRLNQIFVGTGEGGLLLQSLNMAFDSLPLTISMAARHSLTRRLP